jgi:hypothetical protein
VYQHQKTPNAAPTKKPRFGPRLPRIGSQGWWYREAQKSGQGYTTLWDHLTEYELAKNKAIAELDYKVLGLGLTGAPDQLTEEDLENEDVEHPVSYPCRITHKPHWFPTLKSITYQDYQLWSWTAAIKAVDLPISDEAASYYYYLDLDQTKLEAAEVLSFFKKDKERKLTAEAEVLLNSPKQDSKTIKSVKFDIPAATFYSSLNNTLNDDRPIPVTEGGCAIRTKFLKLYLEQRLEEYLALGGTKELTIWEVVNQGKKVADPFYWDLWADLDYLRIKYNQYCNQHFIDPEVEEEGDIQL